MSRTKTALVVLEQINAVQASDGDIIYRQINLGECATRDQAVAAVKKAKREGELLPMRPLKPIKPRVKTEFVVA